MLGVLFIAGGFFAGAAVAQPAINVSTTGSGSPGGTATFSVTLAANGDQVAATQNDITFDPNIPVAVASGSNCAITTSDTCTTDANCPVLPTPFNICVGGSDAGKTCTADTDCSGGACSHEPCLTQTGTPECTAQATGKQGFFSFLPHLCVGGSSPGTVCAKDSDCGTGTCTGACTPGTNCTGIRAIILAVDNLNAIPDGSTLYTCTVDISSTATVGSTPALTIGNESAGDINQALISDVSGSNGKITVTSPVSPSYTVCDVNRATAGETGDNVGDFGDGSIDIFDYKAIFNAAQLSIDAPAAGTARFSAMDSSTADAPPACGGDGTLDIFDVRQCFNVGQLGATNYVRTGECPGAGPCPGSCTSAVAPQ
jgi:hypothetical protein